MDEYEVSPCFGYRSEGMFAVDYVRVRTLEFICELIQSYDIAGNIAELGVFRGDFSYYISKLLPNRKFYLFDTFEGFAEQEAAKEIQSGNITDVTVDAYRNTSVETVMDRLEGRERIEIRKGYFPETLNGLEDTFAFVSLDVDLEESIYNGLSYFYPRMQRGGYIMIHDYNSLLKGVRRAVERYEKDRDILLMKVPLCDSAGTLVIVKE